MDVDGFLEAVREAFPDPGCPPEWLPRCDCWECVEPASYLRERPSWQSFSGSDCRVAQCTSLMDESFRYYLPAYMVASLVDPDSADVSIDFAAWRFLSYPPELGPNRQLLDQFEWEQRELILQCPWPEERDSI